MATAPPPSTPTPTVQHVTKASSDQLLSKFAELESESAKKQAIVPKQLELVIKNAIVMRKRSKRVASGLGARDLVTTNGVDIKRRSRRRSIDRNSFLLPLSSRINSAGSGGSMVRKLGMNIGRAENGVTAALLAALEKTWRKTVEGASRMFIERHCGTHVRLISDIV